MSYLPDRPFTLFFVRHGVTELNFRGLRCGGDVDVPLTDIGCDQAYLLGKQIEKMNLDIGVIVASSLIRTRQTALLISGVLGGVPVETEALLNERQLGEWNRRPIAETEEQLARKETPPGGESEEVFTERIREGLHRITPYLERRPLLVSSKGVGRVLHGVLGGEGRLQVSNGELVEFVGMRSTEGKIVLDVHRPHQV